MISAGLISLIAVTAGFTLLVVWVYWPSRKARIERHGSIPFDDDRAADEDQSR